MKTTNYEIFKLSHANRPIVEKHVETIIKSINKYGYFNSKPITVTPDMIISDGQHRFAACKKLKIPVVYEIDTIDSNDSMVILNTTSNVWRLDEFINHYANRGIGEYSELMEFVKTNQTLGVSNCISIYACTPRSMSKEIRAGKVIRKHINSDRLYELVMFFKDKVRFYHKTNFIRGLSTFLNDKTTEKKHIERLKNNCFGFIECATVEQYLSMFNKFSKKKTK